MRELSDGLENSLASARVPQSGRQVDGVSPRPQPREPLPPRLPPKWLLLHLQDGMLPSPCEMRFLVTPADHAESICLLLATRRMRHAGCTAACATIVSGWCRREASEQSGHACYAGRRSA